jgi:hypothetical protein
MGVVGGFDGVGFGALALCGKFVGAEILGFEGNFDLAYFCRYGLLNVIM